MVRLFLSLAALTMAQAYEKGYDQTLLMNSVPERVIRLEKAEKKGRGPASVEEKKPDRDAQNKALSAKLKPGSYAIVENSFEDWNQQVVKVSSTYEDGSRQVQLDNGTYARVKYENLFTLSPESSQCCKSNGVEICPGDQVWHPAPTSSLGIPAGKVVRMFENCSAIVRDGLDYVYDVKQIGKSVDCSPTKSSVCVGKMVYVVGYRAGKRYEFEGPVARVFTNGTILVKNGLWLLTTDASAAIVRTDTIRQKTDRSPASIAGAADHGTVPVAVYPELEPYDAHDASRLEDRYP